MTKNQHITKLIVNLTMLWIYLKWWLIVLWNQDQSLLPM